MKKMRPPVIQSAKTLLALLLASFLVFVVVEGLSSTTIAVVEMQRDPELSAPSHYDPSLGWINIPDTDIPDFYGQGKYVRINGQGYRNETETMVQAPPGKVRVVCSGDSFTFGQGVATIARGVIAFRN